MCYAASSLMLIGALCCRTSLSAQSAAYINPTGTTVETRFKLPDGYERIPAAKNSYVYFLRHLPMLPYGTNCCNDPSEAHYAGRLNIPAINNMLQDLHLCIRLRGEYFFRQEQYDKIAFTIINFKRLFYTPWVEGLDIVINDKRYRTKQPKNVDRLPSFRNYLTFVFSNTNAKTLLADVQPVPANNIMPGDMFIHADHPSYTVIVLDVAYNPKTGDRIFLLATTNKSTKTSCILVNPKEAWSGSPWYSIKAGETKLTTPEFVFNKQDLRRFQEMSMASKN